MAPPHNPLVRLANLLSLAFAPSGSAPELKAYGVDANIDIQLTPKGTGVVRGAGVGAQVWSAITTYHAGDAVIDRGGTWVSNTTNTNSQPISGNTDWTLVAGTPYVDVTLVDTQIRNLLSSPQIIVPAPGPGKMLLIMGPFVEYLTVLAVPFSASQGLGMQWGNPSTADFMGTFNTFTNYTTPFSSLGSVDYPGSFSGAPALVETPGPPSKNAVNQPLVLVSDADLTGGDGATLRLFVPYAIITALTPNFYTITAINQGLNQITVTDTQVVLNGATGTFSVVGSTGNDGTYTIVTAVSGAGSTVITTVEAIPDATADGLVEQT